MFKLAILCIAVANCALTSAARNSASASASEHVSSGNANGRTSHHSVPQFVQDIETYQRSLNEYLNDAKNYHTRAYTATYASPNAQAFATSSLVSNDDDYYNQRIIAENQEYLRNIQRHVAAQNEAIQNEINYQLRQSMNMPIYSGGSAAYGDHHRGHQKSYVVPQSYAEPDVDTRFDDSGSPPNYGGNHFDGGDDHFGGGGDDDHFGGGDDHFGGGGDDNFGGGDFSMPDIPMPEPPKMPEMPKIPKIPAGPNLSGHGANGKYTVSATSKGPNSNYAAASSSYSSSSDNNGKKTHTGGSETFVNDNGKIHTFSTRF